MSTQPPDFEPEKRSSEQHFRGPELALKKREQTETGEFEAKKWDQEKSLRESEISIKERAQATSEQDLAFRQSEAARVRWSSPLIVAIIAAAVAALGNAVAAFVNGREGQNLETTRAESARILQMIKTGNADKAAENLKFLVDSGLVKDQPLINGIRTFLASRSPGQGPSLPAEGGATSVDQLSRIQAALSGESVLDVLADQDAIWVLTAKQIPGPVIGNPSGWSYPTKRVSLIKIMSLENVVSTQVTSLPITNDGIVYHDGERIAIFLIYRVGDGTDYSNAGARFSFNPSPLYETGTTPIFSKRTGVASLCLLMVT